MKKVLIYDIAAEFGGALTVLEEYYKKYSLETEVLSYFIVSLPVFKETEHCKVVRVPWIKKSWLHRLYFDYFCIQKIVKEIQPDEIISLQNIGIPGINTKQTVFVHNAIPFSDYKFSLIKDIRAWVYQNLIGFLIYRSLKSASAIIVQTEWMKEAVVKKCNVDCNIILVKKMKSMFAFNFERNKTDTCTFFYPAGPTGYKNHQVVLKACSRMKNAGIMNYKVVFTFKKDESRSSIKIAKIVELEKLPIELIGRVDKNEMERRYRESILLFPSYMETVGLPLIEAQSFNCPIIASDCVYSHDAIGDYKNAEYFKYDDDFQLFKLMKNQVEKYQERCNED